MEDDSKTREEKIVVKRMITSSNYFNVFLKEPVSSDILRSIDTFKFKSTLLDTYSSLDTL